MRLGLLFVAFAVVACSSSGGGEDVEPRATPLALVDTRTAAPTPPPAAPAATARPEPKPLSVEVTKRTKSVARNGTASITIQTAKNAECSINVEYSSGSATAKGLESKDSGSKGVVTWRWKVGGRTTKGEWPIDIWCTRDNRSGETSTSFTVK